MQDNSSRFVQEQILLTVIQTPPLARLAQVPETRPSHEENGERRRAKACPTPLIPPTRNTPSAAYDAECASSHRQHCIGPTRSFPLLALGMAGGAKVVSHAGAVRHRARSQKSARATLPLYLASTPAGLAVYISILYIPISCGSTCKTFIHSVCRHAVQYLCWVCRHAVRYLWWEPPARAMLPRRIPPSRASSLPSQGQLSSSAHHDLILTYTCVRAVIIAGRGILQYKYKGRGCVLLALSRLDSNAAPSLLPGNRDRTADRS
eukprot:6194720-Pleurochrysis_carterae.AAC.1